MQWSWVADQAVRRRQMEKELGLREQTYPDLGSLQLGSTHPPECAECRGRVEYAEPIQRTDKIRQERGGYYGDITINHISIGGIWGSILIQAQSSGRWKVGEPIPPEIVCLMMVGLKLSREAYRHKTDNLDDAQNYLDFVEELS